jgi:3',5'-cyclic AMP phosphodiesterase CpdA
VKITWATDIHLNFLDGQAVRAFLETIAARRPDAVVFAGDIAEAPTVEAYLETAARVLARPVYFVLGNHDFYRGRIAEVRQRMAALTARSELLRWLPAAGVVSLTRTTALVGHDGWGDGRAGVGMRSLVQLNDHRLIGDFQRDDLPARFQRLAALGDEAARFLDENVRRAFETHRHVLCVTHVPPFPEACWHEGQRSDDEWQPYFTCVATGQVLRRIMEERPQARLTVVCGHTHGGGVVEILRNLKVITGDAEYGAPIAQEDLLVE